MFAACQSSGGKPFEGGVPTGPNAPVGLSMDVKALVRGICEREVACPETPFSYEDVESCEREFGAFFCRAESLNLVLPSLSGCLSALQSLDCASYNSAAVSIPACDATLSAFRFSGDADFARLGQRCAIPARPCLDGVCSQSTDACGTCVALKAEGGACEGSDECADGLHCAGDVCSKRPVLSEPCDLFDCAEGTCFEGRCSAYEDVIGKACDVSRDSLPCGEDLICRDGKCAVPSGRGGPCQDEGDCRRGLVCVDGSCSLGVACGEGKEGDVCIAGACGTGLGCARDTQRCTKLLANGAACTPYDGAPCAESSYCAAVPASPDAADGGGLSGEMLHECQPKLADGSPCSSFGTECLRGICNSENVCGPERLCR